MSKLETSHRNWQEAQEIDAEAAAAVADAMIVGYAKLLSTDPTKWGDSFSEEIEYQTYGWCSTGSNRAATYLAQNYAELFEQIFLLKGNVGRKLYEFTHWDFHMYFVAKSVNGLYYAGSPANHNKLSPTPLTTVLCAPSLGDLLKIIKEINGGSWPNTREIETSLKKYVPLVPNEICVIKK